LKGGAPKKFARELAKFFRPGLDNGGRRLMKDEPGSDFLCFQEIFATSRSTVWLTVS
jgi:hypothetical protein